MYGYVLSRIAPPHICHTDSNRHSTPGSTAQDTRNLYTQRKMDRCGRLSRDQLGYPEGKPPKSRWEKTVLKRRRSMGRIHKSLNPQAKRRGT